MNWKSAACFMRQQWFPLLMLILQLFVLRNIIVVYLNIKETNRLMGIE